SSALAQGDNAPRNSAAELAIDAAIPRPEPANLPPPGPGDFKLDAGAPADATPADATKAAAKTAPEVVNPKPADVATVPISEPASIEAGGPAETAKQETPKADALKADTATTEIAKPGAKLDAAKEDAASVGPVAAPETAKEPVKAASNVAPADQPVAERLRDVLGAKSARYFDRKAERAAVE